MIDHEAIMEKQIEQLKKRNLALRQALYEIAEAYANNEPTSARWAQEALDKDNKEIG